VDGKGGVKLVDVGEGVRRSACPSAVLPPVCLEFSAPELVLGQSVSHHADLWSLGVFLYVLLRYLYFPLYIYFFNPYLTVTTISRVSVSARDETLWRFD